MRGRGERGSDVLRAERDAAAPALGRALAAAGHDGVQAQRLVDDRVEVRHLRVVLRVERVLPRGVELVDLGLQPRVHVRVREQAVGDARERDRGRVCPCDNRQDAVVDEVLYGRRRLVR